MAIKQVFLPDIGNFKEVDVTEVLVAPGDSVDKDSSLVILESDKASMEVPSPDAGVVKEIKIQPGNKVSSGCLLLLLEIAEGSDTEAVAQPAPEAAAIPAPPPVPANPPPVPVKTTPTDERLPPAGTLPPNQGPVTAHAGPSVRRFARELGVDLARVAGSGPKGRITHDDVRAYVKGALAAPPAAASHTPAWSLPEWPLVDFAAFGPVQTQPLSRLRRLSGANLHRNWLAIPHVTQFDEADITELEAFRHEQSQGQPPQRLTLLVFLLKACVAALKHFPEFNASLDASGEHLILKQYFHLGVAVDTPQGLVVPVIRDVDKKGLRELATELAALSDKARTRKLGPEAMQGGCFSISSLGGIGGGHFTPIVNAPEVAILGVGRAAMKPVWDGGAFQPRRMLPLSLSYDHRVIDGVAGARFITYLNGLLGDIRRLLL